MVGVQLSLPFSSCAKLTDEQKCKLFLCQGRRLSIDELELHDILKHCKQQGWLNNGLALVYEYAGLMDQIGLMAKALISAQNELEVQIHMRDAIMTNAALISLSSTLDRLFQVVFQWRLLQGCPRPIFVHEGLQAMTFSSFVALLGRRIVEFLAETAESGDKDLWKLVPKPLLVLLLTMSRFFADIDEMRGFLSDNDPDAVEEELNMTFLVTKSLMECEDRVAETWRLSADNRPALRFPFPASSPFAVNPHTEWFTAWLTQSSSTSAALAGLLQRCAESVQRNSRYAVLHHVLLPSLVDGATSVLSLREKSSSTHMRTPQALLSVVKIEPLILQVHRAREIKESLSRPVSAGMVGETASRARSAHSSTTELVPETPSPTGFLDDRALRRSRDSPTESNSTTSRSLMYSPSAEERRAVDDQMRQMMEYEAQHRDMFPADDEIRPLGVLNPRDLTSRTRSATKSDERVLRTESSSSSLCATPVTNPVRGRFFSEDFSRSTARRRERAMTESVSGLVGHFLGSSPGKRKRDRGRARAQSVDVGPSLLVAAFEKVDERGWNLEWTAAAKIAVWFRLLLPRVKLLRRLLGRQCIVETIDEIIDNTMRNCRARAKRKLELLRQGAAVKIQRAMRHWYFIERQLQWERAQQRRYDRMIAYLSKWKYAVLTAVRLWKFIRRFVAKKDGDNSARMPRLRHVFLEYFVLFAIKERTERQSLDVANMGSHRPLEKMQRFRAIERAIGVIQKLLRKYVEKKRAEKAKLLGAMSMRICMFFMRCLAVRKMKQKKLIHQSATRIQKFLRGVRIRRQVFRIVSAGLRLGTSVRRYLAYRSLKSQLRRVDRPLTVQLHGLRDIPLKMINHMSVKIKVSVWWNPLLHIVSQRDAMSIVQSKRPQFVFESGSYKLHAQEEAAPSTVSAESAKIQSQLQQNAQLKRFTQLHRQASPAPALQPSPSRPPSPQRQRASRVTIVQPNSVPARPESPHRPSSPQKPILRPPSPQKLSDAVRPQSPLRPRGRPTIVQPLDVNASRASITSSGAADNGRLPPLPSPIGSTGRRESALSPINERQPVVSFPSVSPHPSFNIAADDGEEDDEDDEAEESDDTSRSASDRNRPVDSLPNIEQPKIQIQEPARASFTKQLATLAQRPSSVNTEDSADGRAKYVNVMRGTLNFARRLGNSPARPPSPSNSSGKGLNAKYSCNFEDLTIKIPGCHGNSVLKFEILDADRKLGQIVFFLTKERGMMYWGGEYQKEIEFVHQKRAILMNSQLVSRSTTISPAQASQSNVTLDFRLIAGVALRSKCQWGRIIVRGKGPLKRTLQGQDILSSLTLFDNWRRFYLSLDEFGLFLFDNKFSTRPFFSIPIADFKSVEMDNTAPVRDNNASKNIVEDITSVVLTTSYGDEIFMRFPDAASRMSWHEVFMNVLKHLKKSSTITKEQSWLAKSISTFSSTLAKLNLSPLRLRVPASKTIDDSADDDDDEEIVPLVTPSQMAKRATIVSSARTMFVS